ncbi:MFS transporter [Chloroflexota bacterium]
MMSANLKRHSIFYGWWIVIACFLINMATIGTISLGFTAFFEPIAREFGWSYAQVSFASSLRGMEMGILAPVFGLVVDKWGPRKIVFGGAFMVGIGLTLVSRANNLAMFYGSFVILSVGMSACFGVVLYTTISHWFRRRTAMAMGIATSGIAIGGLMIPLATVLIDVLGWRMAMLSLGLGTGILIALLSLLLRHKPEQYGYLPDGAVESMAGSSSHVVRVPVPSTEAKLKLSQVLASMTFWKISLPFMVHYMTVSAMLTHFMPYFSSIGILRTASSLIASTVPLITITGRIGCGWLGDKYSSKWLTTMVIGMVGLGIFFFGYIAVDKMWLAIPSIIFLGVSWGGASTMIGVITKDYYGRSNFGPVLGFIMGVATIGSIIGPTLAGFVFDTWGRYQSIWFGFAVLAVAVTVLMMTVPPLSSKTNMV